MSNTTIITGASSGIGKALALELAKRGHNLGLTARRMDRLEALKAEIHAQHPQLLIELRSLDVNQCETIAPSMQALIDQLGTVHTVVVNAGVNALTAVGKGQLAEQLAIVQTNLMGAIATVDAAAEYFRAHKGGHVVGISSLASLTPIPKQAAYCATKSAFSMYMDCAAIELKKHNIHFTKILPGFVKTEIVDNMEQFPFLVSAEQAAREMADHIEKKHAVGVVPGYPWKFIKPLMSSIPTGLWKYMKV